MKEKTKKEEILTKFQDELFLRTITQNFENFENLNTYLSHWNIF